MRRRTISPSRRAASSTSARMRHQPRRAVGRGRGIDDIAADGRGVADLVVGEPHRAARHARQRARQRVVVEKALDRRGRAEAHAAARRTLRALSSGMPATSISTGMCTSPARPSRAQGKRSVAPATMRAAPAMARHRVEGLVERPRRQIFVAEQHRVVPHAPFILSLCGEGGEPIAAPQRRRAGVERSGTLAAPLCSGTLSHKRRRWHRARRFASTPPPPSGRPKRRAPSPPP